MVSPSGLAVVTNHMTDAHLFFCGSLIMAIIGLLVLFQEPPHH